MVYEFYVRATGDILIGHQFRKIAKLKGSDPLTPPMEAFTEHLPRIALFWEIQLLQKKSKESFDLIHKHDYLMIRKGELDRWVVLFLQTLKDCENKRGPDAILQNLVLQWQDKVLHFQTIFHRFNKKQ